MKSFILLICATTGATLVAAGSALAAPSANTPPQISGSPPTTAAIGQPYTFTPTASDRDGNALRFKIFNRPVWASFDDSTGRLSGTPGPRNAGEYRDIRIRVSDGRSTASLPQFSITVRPAPVANRAPVIGGTPPTSARVGQVYSFRPTASDADGDSLSFSIVNRPAWAAFDTANGTLAGTPGTGATGTHANIQLRVSDGLATATLPTFAINVVQAALGSATLHWQAPTTRSDGSPLTNLAGYRIRYGTSVGNYPNLVQISNAGITSAVVSQLTPATWHFVVSAYDTAGLEGDPAGPVSRTIP